jgi:nicotinate phosphoribosyltransferase
MNTKNGYGVSILDDDLYKLSMQLAVIELFPDAHVTYRFTNRGEQKFTDQFVKDFRQLIEHNAEKVWVLQNDEYKWLKEKVPYFKPWYLEYLKNYRFDPNQVKFNLTEDNNLFLEIDGLWRDTILWEVKLMSMISELYFKTVDTNWTFCAEDQGLMAAEKAMRLTNAGCVFSDFGTRRRRSYLTQDIVVGNMKKYDGFAGTSNVHLAMKHNVTPIGTYAHEFVQGNAVLESFQHANYYAMHNWSKVYSAQLGTALPDTFTTDQFLKNFNLRLAKLFDGVRHDSGDPFEFADKIVAHYNKLRINPLYKTITFSDALNVDKAIEIKRYCENLIKCNFGIGTHFTNDFGRSKALNMVIKLLTVNGCPVIKMSDCTGKITGSKEALQFYQWIIANHTK